MRLRTTHRLLSLLLPAALLITSCSSTTSASGTAYATTTEAKELSASDETTISDETTVSDETMESAEMASAASNTGSTADIIADTLYDPYTMESYDTVPEEFQEWHDDIDYGTVEADVEYYSNTAGDYKYCNVLLPAGYDEPANKKSRLK